MYTSGMERRSTVPKKKKVPEKVSCCSRIGNVLRQMTSKMQANVLVVLLQKARTSDGNNSPADRRSKNYQMKDHTILIKAVMHLGITISQI
jgi:hypothetical protein